jgi:hypothetical protein
METKAFNHLIKLQLAVINDAIEDNVSYKEQLEKILELTSNQLEYLKNVGG